MANLQLVKMTNSLDDPLEGCLRLEQLGEVGELGRSLDEILKRSGAEFEGDVKPGISFLLVEVANNVRMEVGGLQEGYFVGR